MQMQKGISEKGQQCLKKAFNIVPYLLSKDLIKHASKVLR
jgi:hypothetical protein